MKQKKIEIKINNVVWGILLVLLLTPLLWFAIAAMYWSGGPDRSITENDAAQLERISDRTETEEARLKRLKEKLAPGPVDWYNPRHLPAGAMIIVCLAGAVVVLICLANIEISEIVIQKPPKKKDTPPRPVSAVESE